jgi:alkylated DNA repair dioxygenase AlkB
MALKSIDLAGAELAFDDGWMAKSEADALFAGLRHAIPWEVHRIRLFGRDVDSPRLSCWIGDPGTGYTYSGAHFEPNPWPVALRAIRARLAGELRIDFNSVLANLYRDGRDSMGWHSDDEPELGAQPVIASLSLGATRRFVLKHRSDPPRKFALELPHGSLLLMRGATQANYRHALPRTSRQIGPRINLTFRQIQLSLRTQ